MASDDDAQAFLLHRYTRREAIADGFLIDVTDQARAEGLGLPTAVTVAVWEECIEPAPEARRGFTASDEEHHVRLTTVLTAAAQAMTPDQQAPAPAGTTGSRTATFQATAVQGPTMVELRVALTMEGDNGQPVLTIMRSDED
ncbi:DUF6573 family protein [Micromonospora sp.]|uniref:DUF6573 family protein n=1 Tax=Micromonospora sp. TaxID=1876 RepID=UPI003B3A0828